MPTALRSLSGLLRGAVDADDSDEYIDVCSEGDAGRGVIPELDRTGGIALVIDAGNGQGCSSCSCMEETIFSRWTEVICFSLPRLLDWNECAASVEPGVIAKGAVCRCWCRSSSSEASDTAESTLADNSGTSTFGGLELVISIAGVVASWGCGSQQSISRFQTRQLRFSNRRPSSIESAHFEKTTVTRPYQYSSGNRRSFGCDCLHPPIPTRFST